jgi:integrase
MITSETVETYFATDFHGRSPATLRSHRRYLDRFVSFAPGDPANPERYSEWVRFAFGQWGDRTARNVALAASARFLAWCERVGKIDKSPHRMVRMPEPEQHDAREPWEPTEVRRLLEAAAGTPMAWAIDLAWETGMAMADCCLLQWTAVDLNKAMLRVRRRKTKELCTIPLALDGTVLAELVARRIGPSIADWPNRLPEVEFVDLELARLYLVQAAAGGSGLQTQFARLRDRAGLPKSKSFHNLRAAFCSRLANSGMNLAAACKVTGHRDPKMFERYVSADVGQLRDQVLSALRGAER